MSDETTRAQLFDLLSRVFLEWAQALPKHGEAGWSHPDGVALIQTLTETTLATHAETVARLEQEHREQRVTQVVAAMMEHSKRVDAIKVEHAKEISDREAQVAALTAEVQKLKQPVKLVRGRPAPRPLTET